MRFFLLLHGCRRFGLLPRLGARQDGVTALEFALIAPIFILALLGCIEVGFMLMADATLERAANQVTRQARIEYRGDCKNRLLDELNGFLGGWATADAASTHIKLLHRHDPDSTLPDNSCGSAKDVVQYNLGFKQPRFMGVLGYFGVHPAYRRSVIVQNEPYDPAETGV